MRLRKDGDQNYRKTHGAGKRPNDWLDNREGSCPAEYIPYWAAQKVLLENTDLRKRSDRISGGKMKWSE